jgi:hypothetical protein
MSDVGELVASFEIVIRSEQTPKVSMLMQPGH